MWYLEIDGKTKSKENVADKRIYQHQRCDTITFLLFKRWLVDPKYHIPNSLRWRILHCLWRNLNRMYKLRKLWNKEVEKIKNLRCHLLMLMVTWKLLSSRILLFELYLPVWDGKGKTRQRNPQASISHYISPKNPATCL